MTKSRDLLLPALALVALGFVSACNTVKGAGKDVAATGRAVTDAAQTVEEEVKK